MLPQATAIDELARRAATQGLEVRGGFYPQADEFSAMLPAGTIAGSVVLLGFTGSVQWSHFEASTEANDGLPHPLDRWSRRNIGALAKEFAALDIYPSGTPHVPFQRLAARCEPVHQSPIGLQIHPRWGLWHAYRGALVFAERLKLPAAQASAHPCGSCIEKPCLSACPVGAFSSAGYALDTCLDHVLSAAGTDCRERGCRARRACPVGAEHSYVDRQARFHMAAFLRSLRP
jgi:hypothetical protein